MWYYFWRESNGKSAKCKTCLTVLRTIGGTTSPLHNHLKHHQIVLKKKGSRQRDSDLVSEASSSSSVFQSTGRHSIRIIQFTVSVLPIENSDADPKIHRTYSRL